MSKAIERIKINEDMEIDILEDGGVEVLLRNYFDLVEDEFDRFALEKEEILKIARIIKDREEG